MLRRKKISPYLYSRSYSFVSQSSAGHLVTKTVVDFVSSSTEVLVTTAHNCSRLIHLTFRPIRSSFCQSRQCNFEDTTVRATSLMPKHNCWLVHAPWLSLFICLVSKHKW